MNVYFHIMYSSEGAHVSKFNLTLDEAEFDTAKIEANGFTPTMWCTSEPITETLLTQLITHTVNELNAHHSAGWN